MEQGIRNAASTFSWSNLARRTLLMNGVSAMTTGGKKAVLRIKKSIPEDPGKDRFRISASGLRESIAAPATGSKQVSILYSSDRTY